MRGISLEAVIAMGEHSKRTWWRRISESPELKCSGDRQGRAVLSLDLIGEFLSFPPGVDVIETVLAADAGHAEAQNDAGLIFLEAGNHKAAVYWWELSAAQEHSDAMHHLGSLYAGADENKSLMWIARAASIGHKIAQSQMEGLRPYRG